MSGKLFSRKVACYRTKKAVRILSSVCLIFSCFVDRLCFREPDSSDNEEVRKRAASPTYVEEQKALKNSFKKFLADGDERDAEEDDTAGFLKVKVKNEAEKVTLYEKYYFSTKFLFIIHELITQALEETEYVEWLKGQKPELSDKEFEEDVKHLRDYWTDPDLNEGEQFLRDYVLNKK